MATLKTQKTQASVDAFLKRVGADREDDCRTLVRILTKAVKAEPRMWGSSIVGFGDYRYKYANGKENDWFLAGFSPRKQNLTLYIMAGFDRYDALMARLGKHTIGGSCLYVKKLADIDLKVLHELVSASVADLKRKKAS